MKKLGIQEFLLSYPSYNEAIEAIRAEPYAVKVIEYEDRILLLYNLLSSPTNCEITNDCRGLILSKDFENILSRPFRRFYNYTEKDAGNSDFNFANALVQEKADGSLIQVYHDGKKFCVATKGKAFAEGSVALERKNSFYELFMATANFSNNEELQDFFNSIHNSKDYTYLFELVGPENRVLTPYNESGIRYLDKVHKEYGEFYQIDSHPYDRYMQDLEKLNQVSNKYQFSGLRSYIVKNYEELLEKMNTLELLDEGFVCVEHKTGRRIKIKQASYMTIAKNFVSPEAKLLHAITLVFEHEHEEYLTIFPEQRDLFEYILEKYNFFLQKLEAEYNKFKHISDRKLFAEAVKESPHKALFFTKLSKGLSFAELLNEAPKTKKLAWIGDVPHELYK